MEGAPFPFETPDLRLSHCDPRRGLGLLCQRARGLRRPPFFRGCIAPSNGADRAGPRPGPERRRAQGSLQRGERTTASHRVALAQLSALPGLLGLDRDGARGRSRRRGSCGAGGLARSLRAGRRTDVQRRDDPFRGHPDPGIPGRPAHRGSLADPWAPADRGRAAPVPLVRAGRRVERPTSGAGRVGASTATARPNCVLFPRGTRAATHPRLRTYNALGELHDPPFGRDSGRFAPPRIPGVVGTKLQVRSCSVRRWP